MPARRRGRNDAAGWSTPRWSLWRRSVRFVVRPKRDGELPVGEVDGLLDDQTARRLLVSAAEAQEDVHRAIRLAPARASERTGVLLTHLDRVLRAPAAPRIRGVQRVGTRNRAGLR